MRALGLRSSRCICLTSFRSASCKLARCKRHADPLPCWGCRWQQALAAQQAESDKQVAALQRQAGEAATSLEAKAQELAAARGQLAAVQQQLAGLLKVAAAQHSAAGDHLHSPPAAGSPRPGSRSPLGPPLSPRLSRALQAAETDSNASPRHASNSSGGGVPNAGASIPAEAAGLLQQLGAWVASAREQLGSLEVERHSLQQDVQHLRGALVPLSPCSAAALHRGLAALVLRARVPKPQLLACMQRLALQLRGPEAPRTTPAATPCRRRAPGQPRQPARRGGGRGLCRAATAAAE